jgi:hypothetical protein
MFYLQLGDLWLELSSASDPILSEWRRLFSPWPNFGATIPHQQSEGGREPAASIRVSMVAVDELPPEPRVQPFFIDANHPDPDGRGLLTVYRQEAEAVVFSWRHVAQVAVSWRADGPIVAGQISCAAVKAGYLEDVLYTGLAPLLRRRGYYLVHGFAAAYHGRAVLICGPSGSGKTTAGLALLGDGWRYLSNDLVLLRQHHDAVCAYPVPDLPLIRMGSVALLPWLTKSDGPRLSKTDDHRLRMCIREWARPAAVGAVIFPAVSSESESRLTRAGQAVGLAYLMKQSLDAWDQATLDDHTNLLVTLCRQAKSYHLALGTKLEHLGGEVAAIVAEADLTLPVDLASPNRYCLAA